MSMCIGEIKNVIGQLLEMKEKIGSIEKGGYLNTYLISTAENNFNSFIDFEDSGLKTVEILDYEVQNNYIDINKIKKEFIDQLIHSLLDKFGGNNSIMENKYFLVSMFLNPFYKADFIDDDTLESIKQTIQEETNTITISYVSNQVGRNPRCQDVDEITKYLSEPCENGPCDVQL